MTMIVMTECDYLAMHGCGMCDLGEPALHRLPGLSDGRRKRDELIRRQAQKDCEWQAKRDRLRAEYRLLVQRGLYRAPTRIERLQAIAGGHPDNPSVQAARRLIQKMVDKRKASSHE